MRTVLMVGAMAILTGVQTARAVEGYLLYTRGGTYGAFGELRMLRLGGATTKIDTNVRWAQFSPDGARIVYGRKNGTRYELVLAGRDGSNKQVLVGNLAGGPKPCWRRKNTVVYTHNRESKIYAVDVATKKVSVFYSTSGPVYTLSVAADGKRVCFFTKGGSLKRGIWLADVSVGRSSERWVAGGCGNWISPDGSRFTHNLGSHRDMEIRTWAGTVAKSLSIRSTGEYWNDQFWSNNHGDWILYPRGPDSSLLGYSNIWIHNISTGKTLKLTSGKVHDLHGDFWVGTSTATGPTSPTAPSALSATATSDSAVKLSWKDNSGDESGFQIERKKDGGSYTQIAAPGAGTTSYTDSSLQATTRYTYHVRATNAAGNSSWSNEASATTQDPAPTPNEAPVVRAGSDPTVTLPDSTTLDGTVSDDGLPGGAIATTWSKVSGPGNVVFGDANRIDTDVSFSMDGTYVLALTADDGALKTTDKLTVTVLPEPEWSVTVLAPNGAEAWAAGSTQHIRWQAEGTTDVAILYSTDGGRTWKSVASSVDITSVGWLDYVWTIPDEASRSALVRIADYNDSNLFDVSDGSFEITSGPDDVPPSVKATRLGLGGTLDDPTIAQITLDGLAVPVLDGVFSGEMKIASGPATVAVTATDSGGNTTMRTLELRP